MKKTLTALLGLTLCLSLAACGGKEEAKDFTAADADTLLGTQGVFTEALTEIDKETACALYGIDETTVTDCKVYGSTGATAEELAVFVLDSAEHADEAVTAFGYRIEDRKEGLKDYLPDEVGKLDQAVVEKRGSSVLFVVPADAKGVTDFLGG